MTSSSEHLELVHGKIMNILFFFFVVNDNRARGWIDKI
jgi:hypothetical protein